MQNLWATIKGSMNRLCGKHESNIRATVPASKVQKSHFSLVILILKGWQNHLMFGLRTKQKKVSLSGLLIWEKPLQIYAFECTGDMAEVIADLPTFPRGTRG